MPVVSLARAHVPLSLSLPPIDALACSMNTLNTRSKIYIERFRRGIPADLRDLCEIALEEGNAEIVGFFNPSLVYFSFDRETLRLPQITLINPLNRQMSIELSCCVSTPSRNFKVD